MYKITKLTDGVISIGGHKFERDIVSTVPEKVKDYIINTFPEKDFKIEDTTVETKVEEKEYTEPIKHKDGSSKKAFMKKIKR
jgi:hypothetical protein